MSVRGGTENSTTKITVWHHESFCVMTNVGREGRIFLSNPHTNNEVLTFKEAPSS